MNVARSISIPCQLMDSPKNCLIILTFAQMSFSALNLNTPLLNALEELKITEPTSIQKKTFSVIMSGKDVIGIAQTGTGKTFAYLLPCLRQWIFTKDRFPQILILVPTRELVMQVTESVKQLIPYMNLVVVPVFGGGNINVQKAATNEKVDVIVATPGRLKDLVLSGDLKLKNIKKLIIDEVDEMLNLGLRHQIINILDVLPPKRQNIMFSATMTEAVDELIHQYFLNPVTIEATPVGTPLENILQQSYPLPNFHTKVNLLKLLFKQEKEMTKVLVFMSSKRLADRLYKELEDTFKEDLGVIHSNKDQNQRFKAVEKFKDGTFRVLIATDIIARGLDIAEVSHVINFDVPEVAEIYIHRIGRTGRVEKNGVAISFVTPRDAEKIIRIEELMKMQVPVIPLPENLEISDVLLEDEEDKIIRENTLAKIPKREKGGGAFHEKSAKNKKVNVRRDHAAEKRRKYKKPITRGAKKK